MSVVAVDPLVTPPEALDLHAHEAPPPPPDGASGEGSGGGSGGRRRRRDGSVVVLEARSVFEARLVAGLLRAAGIPVVSIPDDGLENVDFNAAQQALGLEACDVCVPEGFADDALAILAECRS